MDYDFLIRKPGVSGSRITAIEKNGSWRFVSFTDFIEKSNLGDYIAEYVKEAISHYHPQNK